MRQRNHEEDDELVGELRGVVESWGGTRGDAFEHSKATEYGGGRARQIGRDRDQQRALLIGDSGLRCHDLQSMRSGYTWLQDRQVQNLMDDLDLPKDDVSSLRP